MENDGIFWAEVDEQGRVVLPPELGQQYGLAPGMRMRIEPGKSELRLHRPAGSLARVYLEPTNQCNLDCRMCIHHAWDEGPGRMEEATFARILADLAALPALPEVFIGGLGEPLFHPHVVEMVARLKTLGARVELITNGTLLTAARARGLIEAGLDTLWVSIDGARPESYADVRLGAEFNRVIENIDRFRKLRRPSHRPVPQIGIAFVAMKRNIHDLPELLALGHRLGVARVMVTNVMPYTPEMQDERLYVRALRSVTYLPSGWLPQLHLPKMQLDENTREPFLRALDSGYNTSLAGFNLGGANDVCIFIERGAMAVGWDGGVSPCLPLLHTFTSYLHGKPRLNHRHVVGRIGQRSLGEIWNDPDYLAYRERVQSFAFAPCALCGGCDLSESNQADCIGNVFPSCGGCLWAQAVIQCP